MTTRTAQVPSQAREATPTALSVQSITNVGAVMLQLTLAAMVLHAFQLESRTFFNVFVLAALAFPVNAVLPLAHRLPFFAAVSLAGIELVFWPADGLVLVAAGLCLIAACHVPVRFPLLVMQDCVVPAANRLGREGRGAGIFNDSMEWERACIIAPCLGAMERQLEACIRHARARRQFDRPINEFGAVTDRIAAMKVRLETARLMTYHAAWAKQGGGPAAVAASIAKLYISNAWIQSCSDAVQIHGGYGYTTEYQIERDLRDATAGTLYSGTTDIQKAIITRSLGL